MNTPLTLLFPSKWCVIVLLFSHHSGPQILHGIICFPLTRGDTLQYLLQLFQSSPLCHHPLSSSFSHSFSHLFISTQIFTEHRICVRLGAKAARMSVQMLYLASKNFPFWEEDKGEASYYNAVQSKKGALWAHGGPPDLTWGSPLQVRTDGWGHTSSVRVGELPFQTEAAAELMSRR